MLFSSWSLNLFGGEVNITIICWACCWVFLYGIEKTFCFRFTETIEWKRPLEILMILLCLISRACSFVLKTMGLACIFVPALLQKKESKPVSTTLNVYPLCMVQWHSICDIITRQIEPPGSWGCLEQISSNTVICKVWS